MTCKARPQGDYIAQYAQEVEAIRPRRFAMLPVLWEILFKIIFVSATLFWLDCRLALLTLFLLTTPLYLPKLMEKRVQNAQTNYLKAAQACLADINDWLAGFETIKNFSIERVILARFDKANRKTKEKLLRDARLGAAAQLITTLMSYLSYFAVLVCAAWLVLNGTFTAGDFFVAMGMIDQLSYPLISLAEIIRQLTAVKPICDALEAFITQGAAPSGDSLEGFRREIRFRNVSFGYEGKPPVLRNFNWTVRRGGRYLLKGPSGCGKTTAVNLLLRYFDARAGVFASTASRSARWEAPTAA